MSHSPKPEAGLTPLARKLAKRIAASGPLSFHDYMEACLYDAEHGYYKNRDPLGRGGDFITAPEISQVFGELIGLWAGEVWHRMGQPGSVHLVELGPGRGTLMADALRALRVLPEFLKSVTVHLVETSGPLQRAQAAALAGAGCAVEWHARLSDVPPGPAIVIANEFLDCLPVRQFAFEDRAGLWRERLVAFDDWGFELILDSNATPSPGWVSEKLQGLEDGAIFETRPAIPKILETFAERAEAAPVAALIVDYGHTRPSFGDTVQAVRHHRFAGIFDAPGETDLTAHVDLADLIARAREHGLVTSGPMPMGEWLLRLGLETRFVQLIGGASQERTAEIRSRIGRLIDPAQMGVLFKVVALSGGGLRSLPPFS